jgi:rhomboid family GlyGly-CTERM serine protease
MTLQRIALRRLPLSKSAPRLAAPATLAILALSLASSLFPELALALQFDRARITAGDYWRVLTGHITHWTAEHLFWDAAMFLALGIMLERSGRGRFVACLLASALAISAGVWFLQPELATYRGLSGLDTALFAMLAVELIGVSRRRRDLLVPVLLLAGLSGKLAFELTTGATVFVNSGEAFVPVPVAHSIGALVGAALGAMGVRRTD